MIMNFTDYNTPYIINNEKDPEQYGANSTQMLITDVTGQVITLDNLPDYIKYNPNLARYPGWTIVELSSGYGGIELIDEIDVTNKKVTTARTPAVTFSVGDDVALFNPFISYDFLGTQTGGGLIDKAGSGWRQTAVSPGVIFKHSDGRYIMLVNGTSGATPTVGAFESDDMITWDVLNSDMAVIDTSFKAWTTNGVRVMGQAIDNGDGTFTCGVVGLNGSNLWVASWLTFDEDLTTFTSTDSAKFTGTNDIIAISFAYYNSEYHVVYNDVDYSSEDSATVTHEKASTLDGTYANVSTIDDGSTFNSRDTIYYSKFITGLMLFVDEDDKLKCMVGAVSNYNDSFNEDTVSWGYIEFDDDTDSWTFNGIMIAAPRNYSLSHIYDGDYSWANTCDEHMTFIKEDNSYYVFVGMATSYHKTQCYVYADVAGMRLTGNTSGYDFVSIAQSLRYRSRNSLMQSFDNTLLEESDIMNELMYKHCNIYRKDDDIKIQVRANKGETPMLRIKKHTGSSWSSSDVNMTYNCSYEDFDIYENTLNLGAYADGDKITTTIYFDDGTYLTSEPIKVKDYTEGEMFEKGYLKFQWYNFENDFGLAYDTGIENMLWLNGYFKDFEPKAERSVYDNLKEKVKLNEIVYRNIILDVFWLPRYMAEQIQIALAHSSVVVNDIEFVSEEEPDIGKQGNSNMVSLNVKLTQKEHERLYW